MAAKREFEKGMVKHHMLPIWLAFLGYPPFQTQPFIDVFIVDHHVPQCFLQHLPHAGPNIGGINLTILVYHQHVY